MYIYIFNIYVYIFNICIYIYMPPKSIVDAWYKNIGYRFLVGGPIALQFFIQINTE